MKKKLSTKPKQKLDSKESSEWYLTLETYVPNKKTIFSIKLLVSETLYMWIRQLNLHAHPSVGITTFLSYILETLILFW